MPGAGNQDRRLLLAHPERSKRPAARRPAASWKRPNRCRSIRRAGPTSNRLSRQVIKCLFQIAILMRQLMGLAIEDNFSVMDEQDPVGHRLNFLENMGRNHDGLRLAQL